MTHAITPTISTNFFANDHLLHMLSRLLLCLAVLFSFSRAEGATMSVTDSSDFYIFGTVTGADHIYIAPQAQVTIGWLSAFNSSFGILTGVKVYASFVGSYEILSHCSISFCDFTTRGSFSDGFTPGLSPPGSNFSDYGYSMPINLAPPSLGFFGSSMSRSGNTHFSEQVVIDPIYFDQYLDTGRGVYFAKSSGYREGRAHIYHENNFGAAFPYLEACIDDCGEGIALLSLGVWLAGQNQVHLLYNDTHFKYSGRRFFQVDYTYDPYLNTVPAPATLPLLAAGLGLIAYMGRGRKKPVRASI
jgi:hypothetical protein